MNLLLHINQQITTITRTGQIKGNASDEDFGIDSKPDNSQNEDDLPF